MEEGSCHNIEGFIETYLEIKLSYVIHSDYYEQVTVPEIEKLKKDSAADYRPLNKQRLTPLLEVRHNSVKFNWWGIKTPT